MWTSPSLSLTKDCSFSERETRAEKLCPKIELKFSVSPAVLLYGKCLHLFGRGIQTLQEFCSTTPRASFHARRKPFWHHAAMSKIHNCPENPKGIWQIVSFCVLCIIIATFWAPSVLWREQWTDISSVALEFRAENSSALCRILSINTPSATAYHRQKITA